MNERELLPTECDACGEEEDPIGLSDRVRIIGICTGCGDACCEACMPHGSTRCLECVKDDLDYEPADVHPGDGHYFGD